MKKGIVCIYYRYLKRLLDVFCSAVALIVLSPLLIVISILIRVKLDNPILFRQERIGKDEKPFVLYKFRTMSNATDTTGKLLTDIERIGKFGSFLRSSSIDELPSLLNILKGDMSIIGPRPLPTIYQPYFYQSERKRHSIRGGLSGLAQVNGRNALSWEDKFEFDVKYVDEISFSLDVKILLITIKKVLKRTNIGLRGVTGPEDFNTYRSKRTSVE